jgi:hypothetical protein
MVTRSRANTIYESRFSNHDHGLVAPFLGDNERREIGLLDQSADSGDVFGLNLLPFF